VKDAAESQQEKDRDQVTIYQRLAGAEIQPQSQQQMGEDAFHNEAPGSSVSSMNTSSREGFFT
jgi:hypothetical protein